MKYTPENHFFGTQPYDRESFDRINADYGIRIKYHRSHLNIDNVPLAQAPMRSASSSMTRRMPQPSGSWPAWVYG